MNRCHIYLLLVCILLVGLAACGPARAADQPTPGSSPTSEDKSPEDTPTPENAVTALADTAKNDLAQRLGVAAAQIAVASVTPTEFSDTSLDVSEPGQMYAQVITPGYVITLTAEGKTYRYHAGDGRVVAAPAQLKPSDAPPPPPDAPPQGELSVEGVEVTASQVTVRGTSTLPAGTCISAELWAGGVRQAWWPTDVCAPVEAGAWTLVVPLSDEQALQPGVQYMLRAYQPGGPNVVSTFPFDLDAPPSPPDAPPQGELSVEGVEVTASQVTVRGTSTLPAGTCISAELWAGGVRQAWWPTDVCAPVEAGAWTLVVPLSDEQALQPGVQYMLRAYQPGGPNVVSTFPFDLDAPPQD